MKAILNVWPWVRPYWRYAVAALTGSVISVLINLLIPLQTSRMIDDGIKAGDGALVRNTAFLMVGLIVAGMLVSAFTAAMAVRLAFHTITDLRRDLYSHAQNFSFGNLDHLTSGEILTRLTSDMTKVSQILTNGPVVHCADPCHVRRRPAGHCCHRCVAGRRCALYGAGHRDLSSGTC